MQRDIDRLSTETFDVLIVGGGIYGATLARQCALQGLKVALIEKDDFGGATSANSLKIIHGGLRYLQSMDIKRMRQSISARRRLLQIAANSVVPLPCVIATGKRFLRSRLLMGVALMLSNIISWDRNRGMAENSHIPNSKLLSRNEYKRIVNEPADDVTGAAFWHDAIALNTERLTLDFILSAATNGACVANYVMAERYLLQKDRIIGIAANDTLSSKSFNISAKQIIDARGPWSRSTKPGLPKASDSRRPAWALAFNIIVKKQIFMDYTVGISPGTYSSAETGNEYDEGREFFFVPWRGCTIIGTAYKAYTGKPGEHKLSRDDLEKFIQQLNGLYPAAELRLSDVVFVQHGLLPAEAGQTAPDVRLLNQPLIIDHDKAGGPAGLTSVTGVKFTTALPIADILVKEIIKKLGLKYKKIIADPCLTEPAADDLDNSSQQQEEPLASDMENFSISFLKQRYGIKYPEILRMINEHSELAEKLVTEPPVIAAEIIYSVRNEMAFSLSDVVFRRTGIGSAGHPGKALLENIADLLAKELTWSEQTKQQEVKNVEEVYNFS
ncbi:MAG: glycerol-3-phosphate dehydrogenase/oxidase [Gammaproteobacteria bacterium]|nr:MAG: glycerol-3-phosphate dehydrogenase/oxidase [Gammaproteobacteria bacterium]